MEGLSLNMFFFCMNIYNNIIVTARLLQGWGGGGYAPRRKLYETLVLFVVYFVLKMFKNIYFYIKTRCTRGVSVFSSIARI